MPFREKLAKYLRAQHAYDLGIGWWVVLVAAWSLLESVDFWISRVCDVSTQQKWAALWHHPTLGWKVWFLGVCAITTAVIFEGSYRKSRREEQDHVARCAALEQKIIDLGEQHQRMVAIKDEERNAILEPYTELLTWIQFRALELAKDLRRFSVEMGPKPAPAIIAGEDTLDSIKRMVSAVRPWQDRVMYGYNRDFSQRVEALRNDFAEIGQVDFALDRFLKTGAIVDVDQAEEIANRFMALALREIAARVLHGITLKELCCN